VSGPLRPGPPATPADLRAAQERERLLRSELPRVRAAATAWRNGLAGLLAALAGFGLIKGQSDISQLSAQWGAAVGILLLLAVIAGAVGALSLIRAANGKPAVASTRHLLGRSAADHKEALAAATALRRGIALTLGCAALLVAAVGATWYGPVRAQQDFQVTTRDGTECGTLIQISDKEIILKTITGDIRANLTQPSTVIPVTSCPPP